MSIRNCMEPIVSESWKTIRTRIKNYKTILYYLHGGQTLPSKIRTAAMVATGTFMVIVGLNLLSSLGPGIPDFGNAIKSGLVFGIFFGGLFFGIKMFFQRSAARRSRFIKAVIQDVKKGCHATLLVLYGMENLEGQKIFLNDQGGTGEA